MAFEIVILAAGKGQRMHSRIPKVLQDLGGYSLLSHVVKTAKQLRPEKIHIIYGHGGDLVRTHLAHEANLSWILQDIQLGTGHAVSQALPFCQEDHQILVLYGDVPLISLATLNRLLAKTTPHSLTLLTWNMENPFGFGRVLRTDKGVVKEIIEEKDATLEQKALTEIFTGILAAPAKLLSHWLRQITDNNAQGEYLLPDIAALAAQQQVPVETIFASHQLEIQGVNDKQQLAALERAYQLQQAQELLRQGATLRDPARIDIRGGKVNIGKDVIIDVNVIFEGQVSLGDNVKIGANCIIRNCHIADHVVIKDNSILEYSHIQKHCQIGPFARLRPHNYLAEAVHIGNFVELKNAEVGNKTKILHLSYVGDAAVGQDVNVGAGTITCNYDGANKHTTTIEDEVFIGSGTQLIAPVTLGKGATIGAGSTITDDIPEDTLALARSKQVTIKGWQRPAKLKE